jgi:hypothetical protein
MRRTGTGQIDTAAEFSGRPLGSLMTVKGAKPPGKELSAEMAVSSRN